MALVFDGSVKWKRSRTTSTSAGQKETARFTHKICGGGVQALANRERSPDGNT
jgi:hypothetical protein